MAVNVAGNAGVNLEVATSATGFRAAHFTGKPQDPGSLGAYAMGSNNGTTAFGAGAQTDIELYQFRWTSSNVAIIRSVRASFAASVAFAAGQIKMDLFVARSFTAAGTGGGTLTITGNNGKKRTSFGTTVVGEIRTATTAALGAGTKTLDSTPLVSVVTASTAIGNPFGANPITLWSRDTSDEYPITLAQNEGLVVRMSWPATGTPFFGWTTEWCELASF